MKSIAGLLISILSLSAVGCGMNQVDSLPNLVPVSGTVTYNGEPLDHGMVAFAPVDIENGQSATGKIVDGKFNMVTTVSSPGVQIGKYRVAITSYEIDPNAPTEMPPPGTEPEPPKSLIPEKYTNIKTSGFEIEVVKGMEPLKYELVD